MYPYITLADETEITHSHLIEADGNQTVEVHFERPTETGFDSARCVLPSYQWKFSEGFTPEEMDFSTNFCTATPICSTAMRRREGFTVPSLFRVGGYLVFFWSNENGEPIHVHIVSGGDSVFLLSPIRIYESKRYGVSLRFFSIWGVFLCNGLRR